MGCSCISKEKSFKKHTPNLEKTRVREEGYLYSLDVRNSQCLFEFELHTDIVEEVDLGIPMLQESAVIGLKGRRLFIAGGVKPNFKSAKTAYMISIVPFSIHEVASLPYESRKLRLVYDGAHCVYAVGGVRDREKQEHSMFGFDYTKNFSMYNLDSDTWQSLPDLLQGTENPAAWLSSDRIYVAGGAYSSGAISTTLDNVQYCSLVSYGWQKAAFVLPVPLHSLQAAVCPRGIIFFGGIDENEKDSSSTYMMTPLGPQHLSVLPAGYSCSFPTYCVKQSCEVLAVNADYALCGLDLTTWQWSVRPA